MGVHSNLTRELERVKNTQSVRLQHESFTTLLQSISEFVGQVKEEEALVKSINKLKKQIKTINKRIKAGEGTTDDEAELVEIGQLLGEAKALENTIKAKRQALNSLKQEVKGLLQAIRK
tara:strand:+ start:4297 stop:4653 length:357 start_codon:yes stop_codon:yes gene_type:complete